MPEPIGPAAESGASVYYVPPPGREVNVFAAFTAGYLRKRNARAEQLFAHRLAQMVPADYSKEINELLKLEGEYLRSLRTADATEEQARLGGANSTAMALAGMHNNAMDNQTLASKEQGAVDLALEQESMIDSAHQKTLNNVRQSMLEAREFEDDGTREAAMQIAIQDAASAAAEDKKLTPGQQAQMAQQLVDMVVNSGLSKEAQSQGINTIADQFAVPGGKIDREIIIGAGRGDPEARRRLFELDDANKATAATGKRPTWKEPEDDAYLNSLRAQRRSYQERDGKTPDIDFTAPLVTVPGAPSKPMARPPTVRSPDYRPGLFSDSSESYDDLLKEEPEPEIEAARSKPVYQTPEEDAYKGLAEDEAGGEDGVLDDAVLDYVEKQRRAAATRRR